MKQDDKDKDDVIIKGAGGFDCITPQMLSDDNGNDGADEE